MDEALGPMAGTALPHQATGAKNVLESLTLGGSARLETAITEPVIN